MPTPQQIVGYNVISVVGQGAASTIYAVQDPATLEVFALKQVYRNSAADQRFVDQAINEHDVARQVNHPVIRKTYRIIRERELFIRTRQLLILMELVDGSNLDELKFPSLTKLIKIFITVTQGLQAMHEAGFVHADLKPINILVTDEGAVKVIDLGQSCPIGFEKPRIQGTVDFMAPEQAKCRPITIQTDVFCLGATLYACVTGQRIPARSFMAKPGEIKQKWRITPPSALRADVPSALDSLIRDCIRRRPHHRPPNMKVLRERLKLALEQLGSTSHA